MSLVMVHSHGAVGLRRLCRLCGVQPGWIAQLVELGVIEAHGDGPERWRFDEQAMTRSLRARRLARDLGLNPPGIAVALELADRLRQARRDLAVLRAETRFRPL